MQKIAAKDSVKITYHKENTSEKHIRRKQTKKKYKFTPQKNCYRLLQEDSLMEEKIMLLMPISKKTEKSNIIPNVNWIAIFIWYFIIFFGET